MTLRLRAPAQPQHFRTDVEAWLGQSVLAPGTLAVPTFRVTLYSTRSGLADSILTLNDAVDSSAMDMAGPQNSQGAAPRFDDVLRGMRTETRMDSLGHAVRTRVVSAPAMPADAPVFVRGMQSLAVAGLRLSTFALPFDSVAPGDSWTDTLRFELGAGQGLSGSLLTGGGIGLAVFRLERLETRDTRRIAVLSAAGDVQMAGQDPQAAATAVVTVNAQLELDVEAGQVIRSQAELSGPMATRMGTMPVRVRVAMRRLGRRGT